MNLETASLIVAAAAFILTIYEIKSTQRHNRLSVTPHLSWQHQRDWSDSGLVLKIAVENNGLGPARIKCTEFFLRGEPFLAQTGDPISEFVDTVFSGKFPFIVRTSSALGTDCLIKAQSSCVLVAIEFPGLTKPDSKKIDEADADILICYESLYGETRYLDTRKKNSKVHKGSSAEENPFSLSR